MLMSVEVLGLSLHPILHNISLEIERGESIAIVGPNGAGKTSFLKCLAGLQTQTQEGLVRAGGMDLGRLDSRKRAQKIAYVSEDLALEFDWTLEEIVSMGRYAHDPLWGRNAAMNRERMGTLIEAFGIASLRNHPFRRLSGGERQMGLIVRALYQNASLILFDETTSKIDLERKRMLVRWFRAEHERKSGVSFVWVDHDLGFLSEVSRRTLLMRSGKIAFDGPTEKGLAKEGLRLIYPSL